MDPSSDDPSPPLHPSPPSTLTSTSFDAFNALTQSAALTATRNAAFLPGASDMGFHRSMDSGFAREVDAVAGRVLGLTNRLLGLAAGLSEGKGKGRLRSGEGVVDDFHSVVVDSMDRLLEGTDIALDAYLGRSKAPAIAINAPIGNTRKPFYHPHPQPQSQNQTQPQPQNQNQNQQIAPSLQYAAYLPKPQLKFASFASGVNNNNNDGEPSRLKHKWHARVPLGYVFREEKKEKEGGDEEEGEGEGEVTHPYHYEITHLSHPSFMFASSPPIAPLPLLPIPTSSSSPNSPSTLPPSTHPPTSPPPFTFVSTPAQLHTLLAHLSQPHIREVAIDLEHHSYRTYAGFVCLMQVSTREGDWVVDCLDPGVREGLRGGVGVGVGKDGDGGDGKEKGEGKGGGGGNGGGGEKLYFGEVLSDPGVVKVFHGADSDILWLQQDFGLHVVNLFDTYHASKVLDFPRHGLKDLLAMYADFEADKRWQVADWRVRPLPQEMLEYARSDTHFLLYIYDNLRNALLDLSQSRAASLSPPPPSTQSASSAIGRLSIEDEETNAQSEEPQSAFKAAKYRYLNEVLARSAQTSLRVYHGERYDYERGTGSGGWDGLARKWNKPLLGSGAWAGAGDGEEVRREYTGVVRAQREVFRGVHAWRDRVARDEDESARYILPNHYLFQLAENPPADMAALLRIFRGVPPPLRKRAGELLEVVREGVRRGLGSASKNADEESMEAQTPTQESVRDVVMETEAIETEVKADVGLTPSSTASLWSSIAVASKPATPMVASSSLFRTTLPLAVSVASPASSPAGGASLASASSALFGGMGATGNAGSSGSAGRSLFGLGIAVEEKSDRDKDRFKEVVARIHGALAIAPDAPTAILADIDTSAPPEASGTGMQIDVPYVPASRRQTKIKEPKALVDDSIVIVGQARQKKRKRTKQAEDVLADGEDQGQGQNHESGSLPRKKRSVGSQDEGEDAAPEPYDFSSAPNILDDAPEREKADVKTRRKTTKEKAKGNKGGIEYGNFPAPPRAYSELKSGNKSHTFK